MQNVGVAACYTLTMFVLLLLLAFASLSSQNSTSMEEFLFHLSYHLSCSYLCSASYLSLIYLAFCLNFSYFYLLSDSVFL